MSSAKGVGKESELFIQWSGAFRHFEFPEILQATEDFAESLVIGSGSFGKVYKGKVVIGSSLVVVAIKRLDPFSSQGPDEFHAEVKTLSMLRHRNIVSLIGSCTHEQEKILVYEYMPNGTLDAHLHKRATRLSWPRRLNICIDAARGLRYLHDDVGVDFGVIHRDFKSSNILLHESWTAKISDFGLSKTCPTNQPSTHVSTLVKGSFGYFDPNYYRTGKLTRKSDVYAFGVLLFEVLCRKRAVHKILDGEWRNLALWAQECIKKGNLEQLIDSDIMGEISPTCLKEFVRIAEGCLHDNPEPRPTIANVVTSLENVLTLQKKFNNSPQRVGGRIPFHKMVDMLPFSNRKNSVSVQGDSSLSINSEGNDRIASSTAFAHNDMFPEMKEVPVDFQSPSPILKEFRFDDLRKATKDFRQDLILGKGQFGEVFLGWVDQKTLAASRHGDGIPVAVKSLDHYYDWETELNVLGQIAHPNIIRLLGYCKYKRGNLLVYEYMPRKSFDRFLFTDTAELLSWGTRLWMMVGVVRGLTYLHSANLMCQSLKPSNILLDENFNAKLAGFEKYVDEDHKTLTRPTNFYADNYYNNYYTSDLSIKTNIYSFGVTLLESMTGQRAWAYNQTAKDRLEGWATKIKSNRRNLIKIMDPRLEGNYPLQGALDCANLALRCIERVPEDRPTSEEVWQSLRQIYALHGH